MKKIILSVAVVVFAMLPAASAQAVEMGEVQSFAAYVTNAQTGKVLYSKNANALRVPASLVKTVSAIVVFDELPDFNKVVTMTAADEVGGGRLYTTAGTQYHCQDLIAAALVASANNAANAMVRCTGLTKAQFVAKMNAKARELGAAQSVFYEPTGIDPRNKITAAEYATFLNAAINYPNIKQLMQTQTISVSAVNKVGVTHNLTNTNELLGDYVIQMDGGKTGFLYESMYNFATVFRNPLGTQINVVILGAPTRAVSFEEARRLGLNAMLDSIVFGAR